MQDFKLLFKALMNLLLLGAFLWLIGFMLTNSSLFLTLFKFNLGTPPAYRFAEKTALANSYPKENLVTLLGPSTVREGFSPTKMHEINPNYHYVNIGITSEGSIYHMELLVDLLARFNVMQKVLVLGLNSRMLIDRPNTIGITRYIDLMSFDQVIHYLPYERQNKQEKTIHEAKVMRWWPMKKAGLRLNYLLLYYLYKLKLLCGFEEHVDIKNFSSKDLVKHNSNTYIYKYKKHNERAMRIQMAGIEAYGGFNPDNYGKINQLQSLSRLLRKALKISNQVVVVIMPEHSALREKISKFANTPFKAKLNQFKSNKLFILDKNSTIEDDKVLDGAHLTESGRNQLSNELIKYLNSEGIL